MTFFCKDGIVYITATLEKSLVAFLNDGWISDTSYASWPHVFRTGPWERIWAHRGDTFCVNKVFSDDKLYNFVNI